MTEKNLILIHEDYITIGVLLVFFILTSGLINLILGVSTRPYSDHFVQAFFGMRISSTKNNFFLNKHFSNDYLCQWLWMYCSDAINKSIQYWFHVLFFLGSSVCFFLKKIGFSWRWQILFTHGFLNLFFVVKYFFSQFFWFFNYRLLVEVQLRLYFSHVHWHWFNSSRMKQV